jgi:hypothetical protein
MRIAKSKFLFGCGALAAGMMSAASVNAALTHRYSFTTDASDSVGGPAFNGTLVNSATVGGGQLQLNNPNFTPNGQPTDPNGYASLPVSILPTSGSVTIESWFTFTGSGFFTEDWTFTDNNNDANPPSATNGNYLVHTISNPQGGPNPSGGGNRIEQAVGGYSNETDAWGTTPGIGFAGGGYLDDGETFMSAVVIDSVAGTLSYYLYDLSQGGVGGLQQTIAALPLSSFNFTNAFLGRSAFFQDNATSGSIDEFRIYNNAQSAGQVAADEAAGPNVVVPVPEPVSMSFLAAGAMGLLARRPKRR